jgi:thiol-disulfide isomerase/thioredoxin
MSDSFKYRIVMFTQPGCPACDAMKPIWAQVAGEIDTEYPELHAGWGEYNVLDDNWEARVRQKSQSSTNSPIS